MNSNKSKNLKIKYLEGEINLENIPFIIKGIEIISQKWEKRNIWRSDYNFFELEEKPEEILVILYLIIHLFQIIVVENLNLYIYLIK